MPRYTHDAHIRYNHTPTHIHTLLHMRMCVSPLQGYGSKFIQQYVMDSGAGGDMNVGEFWSDMHWEDGGEWEGGVRNEDQQG